VILVGRIIDVRPPHHAKEFAPKLEIVLGIITDVS
jgi:hypothetical protein